MQQRDTGAKTYMSLQQNWPHDGDFVGDRFREVVVVWSGGKRNFFRSFCLSLGSLRISKSRVWTADQSALG